MPVKSIHKTLKAESSPAKLAQMIAPTSELKKMLTSFLKLLSSTLGPLALFYAAYAIDSNFSEVAVYPIYAIPILWITSNWGWMTGSIFSILAALLSASISPFPEFNANLAYYINTFATRAITLIALTLLYSNYVTVVRIHKKRYERLKSLISQCPDCGALLCHDGQWRSLEQLTADPKSMCAIPRHDACKNDHHSRLKP